jgi:hypothetical protein
MQSSCEDLVARGIPVTHRDHVCELCGVDLTTERAILCRRMRIELREAKMHDLELRAVLPRWRRDGLTAPEIAERLRVPVWRVLEALRGLVGRGQDHTA